MEELREEREEIKEATLRQERERLKSEPIMIKNENVRK